MSLALLRQQIADIVAPEGVGRTVLSTGVEPLDELLPGGGLPVGKLSEVVGPRGSGRTALLRRMVERTVEAGGWVGYVDVARTLAPRDWSGIPDLWVIRPPSRDRGAWSADVLLRSGAFALVVLDGAPTLPRSVAARLMRLARDSGTALIVAAEDPTPATLLRGAVRVRVEPGKSEKRETGIVKRADAGRHVRIAVEKGGRGSRRSIEVEYVVSVARRMCEGSEVPDRRGAQRGVRPPAGAALQPRAPVASHRPTVGSLPPRPRRSTPRPGSRAVAGGQRGRGEGSSADRDDGGGSAGIVRGPRGAHVGR